MRALPFENFRLRLRVREPQGGAVVMRDGKAIALRREGDAARSRRQVQRFLPAFLVTYDHALSGAVSDRTVLVERDRIDPRALCLGERFGRAVGSRGGHPAVITAGDETLPVADSRQEARIGMRLDATSLIARHQHHRAIAEAEGERAFQPAERRDMRARVKGGDVLGKGGGCSSGHSAIS